MRHSLTQITRDSYQLLKDEYICMPRGKVLIKGKGEMETWFLEGIKADVLLDANL